MLTSTDFICIYLHICVNLFIHSGWLDQKLYVFTTAHIKFYVMISSNLCKLNSSMIAWKVSPFFWKQSAFQIVEIEVNFTRSNKIL